jgi:hypothetical protein
MKWALLPMQSIKRILKKGGRHPPYYSAEASKYDAAKRSLVKKAKLIVNLKSKWMASTVLLC